MSAPGGSTSWATSTLPEAVESPVNMCAGRPFTSSSATTKISPLDGSIAGVPVMPAVGAISPQGRSPDGTGRPSCVDQTTAPVAADSS